jgi:hypothetical protein
MLAEVGGSGCLAEAIVLEAPSTNGWHRIARAEQMPPHFIHLSDMLDNFFASVLKSQNSG